MNLYGFVQNDGVDRLDGLGRKVVVQHPTNIPGKSGDFWKEVLANPNKYRKAYPKLDQFENDFNAFKKRIEEALNKLKECCEKHKDLLGDTGPCKLLTSSDTFTFSIKPTPAGTDVDDASTGKSGTEMAIPLNGPESPLENKIYQQEPDGTWNGDIHQTMPGLIAHELQHLNDMQQPNYDPNDRDFKGPNAKSLKDLWENKMQKAGVDAENAFRRCCPELGEIFRRDRYTDPNQKYQKN